MGNELHIGKAADTRQQILHTARGIILGKGFAAVGLNEILSCAGVPKGSFYHYFKSKEQFGNAMLEDYFEEYMVMLETLLGDKTLPASSQLLGYFRYWLESQTSDTTEEKCLIVKLSAEVTDLSESMRLTLKRGTDDIIRRLAEAVDAGAREGDFPADIEVTRVTHELYYLWLGATLLTKVQRNRDALERAYRATCERLGVAA
ncbi:MAG TPA: TetR/AcrR family transcriptional regulator [Methylophilaceae bacterium]|nr:TetR/AcrR family transcriptional regulator [Methylophilaceae bacterium]